MTLLAQQSETAPSSTAVSDAGYALENQQLLHTLVAETNPAGPTGGALPLATSVAVSTVLLAIIVISAFVYWRSRAATSSQSGPKR